MKPNSPSSDDASSPVWRHPNTRSGKRSGAVQPRARSPVDHGDSRDSPDSSELIRDGCAVGSDYGADVFLDDRRRVHSPQKETPVFKEFLLSRPHGDVTPPRARSRDPSPLRVNGDRENSPLRALIHDLTAPNAQSPPHAHVPSVSSVPGEPAVLGIPAGDQDEAGTAALLHSLRRDSSALHAELTAVRGALDAAEEAMASLQREASAREEKLLGDVDELQRSEERMHEMLDIAVADAARWEEHARRERHRADTLARDAETARLQTKAYREELGQAFAVVKEIKDTNASLAQANEAKDVEMSRLCQEAEVLEHHCKHLSDTNATLTRSLTDRDALEAQLRAELESVRRQELDMKALNEELAQAAAQHEADEKCVRDVEQRLLVMEERFFVSLCLSLKLHALINGGIEGNPESALLWHAAPDALFLEAKKSGQDVEAWLHDRLREEEEGTLRREPPVPIARRPVR